MQVNRVEDLGILEGPAYALGPRNMAKGGEEE
jgi:hypothetical protein